MEPPYGEAYNKIDEPWDSKEEYLRSHYILLREEALRRLRTNINVVQQCLLIQEDKQMSELALYENVSHSIFLRSLRALKPYYTGPYMWCHALPAGFGGPRIIQLGKSRQKNPLGAVQTPTDRVSCGAHVHDKQGRLQSRRSRRPTPKPA